MGVLYCEALVLLAATAVAAALAMGVSDARFNSTKDGDDNSSEQYGDVVENQEEFNCPRGCVCAEVTQGYNLAKCNRLKYTQKFGANITDLLLEDIDSRYPISVDDGIFKKLEMHKVMSIKIINSTISTVSPTAFHGLHELFAVRLTANRLSSLHPETFAYNKNLRFLTLSYNALKFPAKASTEYFLNSSSLLQLDISNCNMRYITSNTFSQVRFLMYLIVAGNKISSIDADAFRSLRELEELDLSDNNILELPGDLFLGNEYLFILQIQRNQIETLYGLDVPSIRTLNAGQMRIKFVGPSIFNREDVTFIQNINLSGNGIEKIHEKAFHKLLNLRNLDLSYNNLDSVSSLLIKHNSELEVFNISNNQRLTQLPENGFALSIKHNIQYIYLFDASNCGLEEISDNALSTFATLKQINLSGNKLQSIGDKVFAHCTRLVEVNLANNLLTTLSRKVFAQNKEMRKLNLRGNLLKVLSSEVFIHTPKLTWLDISQTELTSLWEEKGKHSVVLLNNLIFLNISNNYIKGVELTQIESMDHLDTLDISNNPLVCNHEFKSLMTWLKKHEVSYNYYAVNDSLVAKEEPEEEKLYSWESLIGKTCKTEDDLEKTYYPLTSTVAPASDKLVKAGLDITATTTSD